ncbi:MAG TPA: hemolysin family protein [Gemmatimonadales bacterium]|jgi:CBS domain containing-hemolysin-like protein|nr:hemolysin family protein [Gemmatimonadales bacterium]
MIWLVFLVGLGLAAFGAVSATALVSVSRVELTRAVSHQLRGGPGSLQWFAETETQLAVATATASLGVTLLGAAVPSVFSGDPLSYLAVFVVLVAVPFVLFSSYLVPRWVARFYAEPVRHQVTPALRLWSRLVGLLLPARPTVGPSELRALWREGTAGGISTDEELLMVGGVMTFSERPVREIMTPRTDLVALPEDASLEDIAQVFAQSGYSRIPVYRGTMDEIVGMLHAFDLFKLKPGDPLPVRPVTAAPPSRTCGELLLDMQRERRHLAVVLDEFGGTLGIVTFEDLLEELVGEIFDEHDEAVKARGASGLGGGALLEIDGSTPIAAVEERFEIQLPGARNSTVGGLLTELAGRIPNAGERFLVRHLEFDVLQATPARVERVLVRPGPVAPVTLAPPAAGKSPATGTRS